MNMKSAHKSWLLLAGLAFFSGQASGEEACPFEVRVTDAGKKQAESLLLAPFRDPLQVGMNAWYRIRYTGGNGWNHVYAFSETPGNRFLNLAAGCPSSRLDQLVGGEIPCPGPGGGSGQTLVDGEASREVIHLIAATHPIQEFELLSAATRPVASLQATVATRVMVQNREKLEEAGLTRGASTRASLPAPDHRHFFEILADSGPTRGYDEEGFAHLTLPANLSLVPEPPPATRRKPEARPADPLPVLAPSLLSGPGYKVCSYRLAVDKVADPVNISVNVERFDPSSRTFSRLPAGGRLFDRSGYQVVVHAGEPLHLYLFQVDSANKVELLFPRKSHMGETLNHANPVTATLTLPHGNHFYILDEQKGTETLYLFASRKADARLEGLVRQLGGEAPAGEIQNAQARAALEGEVLQRGIAAIGVVGLKPVQWSHEGKPYQDLPHLLYGFCSGCVHTFAFEHR